VLTAYGLSTCFADVALADGGSGTIVQIAREAFKINTSGQMLARPTFVYSGVGDPADPTSWTDLKTTVPGIVSVADINDGGQVVGTLTTSDGHSRVFVYAIATGSATQVPTPAGYTDVLVPAINNLGQVACLIKSPSVPRPELMVVTNGVATPTSVECTFVIAINDAAVVLAKDVFGSNGGPFGLGGIGWFLYAAATRTVSVVPAPPGVNAGANSVFGVAGLNGAGQLVGGAQLNAHALLFDNGGWTELPPLGSDDGDGGASAINDAGEIVGELNVLASGSSFSEETAVRWEGESPKRLIDLVPAGAGWDSLFRANAINSLGWIVGLGNRPDWDAAPFLLKPPSDQCPAATKADTEVHWVTRGSGRFTDDHNWDKGHAPTIDETAVFDLRGTYGVTLESDSGATGIAALFASHGDPTLFLDRLVVGPSSVCLPALVVGQDASLTVKPRTPGAFASLSVDYGTVGETGELDMDGASLLVDKELDVGGAGIDTVRCRDRGRIDGLTTARIRLGDGAGDAYLDADGEGSGVSCNRLDLLSNSLFEAKSSAHVAVGDTTAFDGGLMDVRGSTATQRSEFTTKTLTLGVAGDKRRGSMQVEDGARVEVTGDASLAADSSVLVSSRTKPAELFLSSVVINGTSTLATAEGGSIFVQGAGAFVQQNGKIVLYGGGLNAPGSTVAVGASSGDPQLHVLHHGGAKLGALSVANGAGQRGEVIVADGGALDVAILVCGEPDGVGTIDIGPDASLSVTGAMRIGPGSRFQSLGETTYPLPDLPRTDSAIVAAFRVPLMLAEFPQLAKRATAPRSAVPRYGWTRKRAVSAETQSARVSCTELDIDGTLSLAGGMVLDGDLMMGATGCLCADVGGAKENGRLVVNGKTTFDGALVLQFMNGYAPKKGDAFDVIEVTGGAPSGQFASVEIRGLAPGAQFATEVKDGRLVATSQTDAVALPTVSVKAAKKKGFEKGAKPATVVFTRKGDKSAALDVSYTVGGTATSGTDYVALTGVVTIPAGKKSATVTITPIDDVVQEGNETVTLMVLPGTAHTHAKANTATVTIVDHVVKAPKRPN